MKRRKNCDNSSGSTSRGIKVTYDSNRPHKKASPPHMAFIFTSRLGLQWSVYAQTVSTHLRDLATRPSCGTTLSLYLGGVVSSEHRPNTEDESADGCHQKALFTFFYVNADMYMCVFVYACLCFCAYRWSQLYTFKA